MPKSPDAGPKPGKFSVVGEHADRINAGLAGSPYSFPDDQDSERRARNLLHLCDQIADRQRRVRSQFAELTREIRERVELITGTTAIFESNKIEDAGLTLEETEAALRSVGDDAQELDRRIAEAVVKGDKHLLETLGLRQATVFAEQLAHDFGDGNTSLREIDIRNLHELANPGAHWRGKYRIGPVSIAGSEHTPPVAHDVPRAMGELLAWMDSTQAPPALAATVVHSWLTIIHPFDDGNGRMARLLANLVLMRANWPPLVIMHDNKLQYLDALADSDSGGDLVRLFDLFVKAIKRSQKQYQDPDLALQMYEDDLRRDPGLRYEIWSNHIEDLLGGLRNALNRRDFALIRKNLPSPSTMRLLEARDSSGNVWLAKVERRRDDLDFLLFSGFTTSELIDLYDPSLKTTSIFITPRDRRPEAFHPYKDFREANGLNVAEIAVLPSPVPAPILIRRGNYDVQAHTIEDAAELLAAELDGAAVD